MDLQGTISWTEAREYLQVNKVSEAEFSKWLFQTDRNAPRELLDLIVHHLYHSSSDVLIAPPHLLQAFLEGCHHE